MSNLEIIMADGSATPPEVRRAIESKLLTPETKQRAARLLPVGIPRWIRCYDSGPEGSCDRFTVVYTGRWRRKGDAAARCQYVSMSANPYHPQGVGMHGESDRMIDVNKWGFAPALGRKCHLGRRIPFQDLPADCRKLILSDYKEIWKLP